MILLHVSYRLYIRLDYIYRYYIRYNALNLFSIRSSGRNFMTRTKLLKACFQKKEYHEMQNIRKFILRSILNSNQLFKYYKRYRVCVIKVLYASRTNKILRVQGTQTKGRLPCLFPCCLSEITQRSDKYCPLYITLNYVYALSAELLPSCEWTLVLTLSTYRVQFVERVYEINILLFGFRAIHFKDCLSFELRFFFYNRSNFMTISRESLT